MNSTTRDYRQTRIIEVFLMACLALGGMVALLWWSAGQDEQRAVSAELYQKCVERVYGVNPSAYYDTHGAFPTCDGTQQ